MPNINDALGLNKKPEPTPEDEFVVDTHCDKCNRAAEVVGYDKDAKKAVIDCERCGRYTIDMDLSWLIN